MSVSDDAAYFHHHCNEMMRAVGVSARSQDILDIIDGHKGQGYGLSTQEELGTALSLLNFFYILYSLFCSVLALSLALLAFAL